MKPRTVGLIAFFIVLFGHALWISFFGTNVPIADQWDGELIWYRALVSGHPSWTDLIVPHNEHRIALTRLFNGAIFMILGGWHPIITAYAQIILMASFVGGLCVLLAKYAGKWSRLAVLFTLITYLLPYSWSNILSGFQNQFSFMIIFAFAGIWLVINGGWLSVFLAIFLGLISPFTMAGGMFGIGVVLAVP